VATILFAWELGSGLGHLARFRPIAQALLRRKHRLVCVVRDLSRAALVFADLPITYAQAPIKRPDTRREQQQSTSYADLLEMHGHGTLAELEILTGAWRELYTAFRPELYVFDHSPTALLSSAGLDGQRLLLGTGFACPPDVYPLPSLRPWLAEDGARGQRVEDRVTAIINQRRGAWGQPPLERLGQMFAQVDENVLATFAELDTYPGRATASYWGVWPGECGGLAPEWPAASGPRVFAYIKPFPAIAAVLDCWRESNCSVLAYAPDVEPALLERYRVGHVRFCDRPVDLPGALASCDVLMCNGSHATTAAGLLAGKPMLLFPTVLEQLLNARKAVEIGAAAIGPSLEPEKIRSAWDAFWENEASGHGARAFAVRHAAFDPGTQVEKVAARIAELLGP